MTRIEAARYRGTSCVTPDLSMSTPYQGTLLTWASMDLVRLTSNSTCKEAGSFTKVCRQPRKGGCIGCHRGLWSDVEKN